MTITKSHDLLEPTVFNLCGCVWFDGNVKEVEDKLRLLLKLE